MTKPELKKKLIAIRDGGMITPLLEELMGLIKPKHQTADEVLEEAEMFLDYNKIIEGKAFIRQALEVRDQEWLGCWDKNDSFDFFGAYNRFLANAKARGLLK